MMVPYREDAPERATCAGTAGAVCVGLVAAAGNDDEGLTAADCGAASQAKRLTLKRTKQINRRVMSRERLVALAFHPLGGAFGGSPLQELALSNVRGKRCGALEVSACLLVAAELPQKVPAGCGEQVV